ncbi:hypothetical protein DMH01_14845 [Amycolatopsis sp. WAC 04182]|uniref:patatin-like phospholipase family protein n=1 Tax=Amycolatopsis sp. WAC 04182 TaxID=2203198 RepID=UPI000F7852AC|nr:patatin-like phospholipase family protein [Amycolatopsis sp. WAC 04182]RSN60576.1 hypothetical protein DMH01_14845 [Amycolatopsis sp. WAC 04182]
MTIALCLSGGGAKGDFELGALRCLYDRGIRPDIIASTSVGSVNAVKLAEGEDPADAGRGLAGLERLWSGLNTNDDMYVPAAWLNHPEMDSRVRDYLTGRSAHLGISGPQKQDGRWGMLDIFVDTWNEAWFLGSDGAALLKSLNLLATKARSLYELLPIRTLLYAQVNLAHIAEWAGAGGRWRMATVALESGRLRYITETGGVLENTGTPVMVSGPLLAECAVLQGKVQEVEDVIRDLQQELRAASTGQKSFYSSQIRKLQNDLGKTRTAFAACVAAQPAVPLSVDVREGVLASAAIPGIFPTVRLGNESYVDGGIREILPVQIAVDLGADQVYAISASALSVVEQPPGTYATAGLADVVSRSVMSLVLNETNIDDLQVRSGSGAPLPSVTVIAPDLEIHDMTTIDPGLVQINKDYGWMRAADVLDGVAADSARWRSATDIAAVRLETWRHENRLYGHEDPTRLYEGSQPPYPLAHDLVIAGRARLAHLLTARRASGGPTPQSIDRWTSTLERHPWSIARNDATFVAQSVPSAMTFGQPARVSVTMRNTGATTWTEAAGYRLGSQAPQDNMVWGSGRQILTGPVEPGDEATFSFAVTVPTPAGVPFQWCMVREGVEWFGELTPEIMVTVTQSPECAQVRGSINQSNRVIAALRNVLDGLDPTNSGDRQEIREIRAQIAECQKQLNAQRAHEATLACP